jgi:hypothetical protein
MRDISKRIRELNDFLENNDLTHSIEDYNMLSKEECEVISNGTSIQEFVKVAKEVIEFKKLYPGWILRKLECSGYSGSAPPENVYKFKYITPTGHIMTCDDLDILNY